MTPMVQIILVGWIPFTIVLFAFLPARKAVLVSMIGGWLLLPQAGISLPGLPNYSRVAAVSVSTLTGILIFNPAQLTRVRMSVLDIPLLVWCLCPLPTSLTNDLGVYDGISGVLAHLFLYGIPYLIGRAYFSDQRGLQELALGFFLSGLIYVPLILFELRFGPQFHRVVYGFNPIKMAQVWRWGWYRPYVFMHHGLELGVWMAVASVIGIWLWRSGNVSRIWRMPMACAAPTVFVTAIACRAANGWVLTAFGLSVLYATKQFRTSVFLIALLALTPAYVASRVLLSWSGQSVTTELKELNAKRAASLRSRIAHEQLLIDKALQRPWFGWGTYNRNRVDAQLVIEARETSGAMSNRSVTDSLWIIALGQRGLVGLVSLGFVLLLPLTILLGKSWRSLMSAKSAAALALAVGCVMFTIDCLANAMLSPVYSMMSGSVIGYGTVYANKLSSSVRATEQAQGGGADRSCRIAPTPPLT